MKKNWPIKQLKDLIDRIERLETPIPGNDYRQLGVRLWGVGAYERPTIDGGETKYKTLAKVEANDVVLNKIWARNGSVSVVPKELSGSYVSGEFPTFTIRTQFLEPKWFYYYTKTKVFWAQCDEKSQGTSGKNRIRPEKFLEIPIPLPPLVEQRRITECLNTLLIKLADLKNNKEYVLKKTGQLVEVQFRKFIKDNNKRVKFLPFTEFTRLERRPVPIVPENYYKEIGTYSYGRGIFHKNPRSGFEVGNKDLFKVKSNDLILQITFAWEGAIALAGPQDDGLYCSVRYPTFRVDETICSPKYALMYLKTEEGVSKLGQLSPGSAGRNRVLSLKRLNELIVPVLPLEMQNYLIEELEKRTAKILRLEDEIDSISQKIIPSVLNKVFKNDYHD